MMNVFISASRSLCSMGILLVFLLCLSQLSVVESQGCKDLTVFNGNSEVPDVPCNDYEKSRSCQDGPSTFPGNLSEGTSVGKPRDFEVKLFRGNYTTPGGKVVLASGVAYKWLPPLDGISREYIKGFYLKMERIGSRKVICRLLDIRQFDLLASTDFRFSYKIFPFSNTRAETYLIELQSLPPPSEQEHDAGLYERHVITVQPFLDYSAIPDVVPSNWTTGIVLYLSEVTGEVSVEFDFPTKESNFSLSMFLVQLVTDGTSNTDRQVYIHRTGSEEVGRHTFTNVPTGSYYAQVWPYDRFSNDSAKCECWYLNSLIGKDCRACQISRTEVFSYINHQTTTVATTTTARFSTSGVAVTDATGSENRTGGPNTSGVDVAAVVAGVLGVVVAVVVVVIAILIATRFGLHRRLLKCIKKDKNENNNKPGKPSSAYAISDGIIDIPSSSCNDLAVPELSEKTIFLLASEDHEYFIQALNSFAQFLSVHCKCRVIFASQQTSELRKMGTSYCWLSSQIDNADFVVIVSSEGASHLYDAYRNRRGYSCAHLGPEGDLFTPAISHICGKISAKRDVDNIITVYFDHTSPRFHLPIAPLPSCRYQLPNHLRTFLIHIHNLDENKMDLSKVCLPLQGNVKELEGGKQWITAVQMAQKYEREKPSWFTDRFGKPEELNKPPYDSQISGDSGYSGGRNSGEFQRRLSSISQHVEETPEDDVVGDYREKFVPPSIISAQTVPFSSCYSDHPRPSEVDSASLTDDFIKLNMKNDQECQHYQDHRSQECEQDNYAFADHRRDSHVYTSLDVSGGDVPDGNCSDCISVSSAQSV